MSIDKWIFIPKVGCDVLFRIGTSALVNFQIIDDADPHHIWFHVEGLPSCHVIAYTDESWNRKQLPYVVKQGAVLCKMHSKYTSSKKLPIIYTAIENVEKTNVAGSVHTTNEKKILI